jgi:hypothetical protein
MPTIFERTKALIDQLYPIARKNIRDPKKEVHDIVKTRLKQLSHSYGGKLLKDGRDPINYSFTTTHIAYAYRALSSHADWMYQLLESSCPHYPDLFDRRIVRISSIGGGPGSDLLAFEKFSAKCLDDDVPVFAFSFFDREERWENVRDFLMKDLDDDMIEHSYHFDITEDIPEQHLKVFEKSDIITFSFFLSEVWSFNNEGSISDNLSILINNAKAGCIFLYIDNGGSEFSPLVEDEFKRQDIEVVISKDHNRLLMSFDEQSNVLGEYKEKFGQSPKLQGEVSWRVWRKIDA